MTDPSAWPEGSEMLANGEVQVFDDTPKSIDIKRALFLKSKELKDDDSFVTTTTGSFSTDVEAESNLSAEGDVISKSLSDVSKLAEAFLQQGMGEDYKAQRSWEEVQLMMSGGFASQGKSLGILQKDTGDIKRDMATEKGMNTRFDEQKESNKRISKELQRLEHLITATKDGAKVKQFMEEIVHLKKRLAQAEKAHAKAETKLAAAKKEGKENQGNGVSKSRPSSKSSKKDKLFPTVKDAKKHVANNSREHKIKAVDTNRSNLHARGKMTTKSHPCSSLAKK